MKTKTKQEIKEYCKMLKLMAVSEHFEKLITETEDMGEYLRELLALDRKSVV